MRLASWLDRYGVRLIIQQDVKPGQRQKNRVILEYWSFDGTLQTVGARTTFAAVTKACLRMTAMGRKREAA
jgi:hypothetical protein